MRTNLRAYSKKELDNRIADHILRGGELIQEGSYKDIDSPRVYWARIEVNEWKGSNAPNANKNTRTR